MTILHYTGKGKINVPSKYKDMLCLQRFLLKTVNFCVRSRKQSVLKALKAKHQRDVMFLYSNCSQEFY